jgi:RNA polymerase sigma-70 factor (ECF subfamily)
MWPDAAETQALLDLVRQDQPEAVDRLLTRHRAPLRRMIDLGLDPRLAQRLDASDVVQEVLLEASRRLNDYLRDPALPFHLWLRHMARDHLIDAHRRHRQAQCRTLDRERPLLPAGLADHSSLVLGAQFIDQELTPASAAIRQELQARLERALAELSADDREIIVLRVYEQLSNQEVAAELGLTEPAAGMRFVRAVRRLKALLEPGGGNLP